MGQFRATGTVEATGDALFAYLSQVGNLPDYSARIASTEPGDGEEVHKTTIGRASWPGIGVAHRT